MERTPEAYTRGILAAVLEPWVDGLSKVGVALRDDGKLQARLDDPALDPAAKLSLLVNLAPTGAPAELRNFLAALLANNDLRLLGDIQSTLARVISEEAVGPQAAYVTSAIPLASDEQEQMRARLSRQFGPNLEYHFQVNPEILGGVIVRVGDKLIDDSVRGRIEALRHSLGVRAA